MIVGIYGLGLIGGSMAKAYKANSDHKVYAYDKDETTLGFARLSGAIDAKLDSENIGDCDLVMIALYPQAAVECMKEIAPKLKKDATVIDLCGTKVKICECGFELARRYGFTFVGGHPMAGTQYSGFKYAKEDLFCGAPMIIVPPVYDDISFLDKIKTMLSPAGFGKINVTTADEHDRMIAFTSQLAHVVSNAYVKSPSAQSHKGFSAGSYKDLTRVAWLNENMWSELFIENKEFLTNELDNIISSLSEYRNALDSDNGDKLRELLRDGRICKERVDG